MWAGVVAVGLGDSNCWPAWVANYKAHTPASLSTLLQLLITGSSEHHSNKEGVTPALWVQD